MRRNGEKSVNRRWFVKGWAATALATAYMGLGKRVSGVILTSAAPVADVMKAAAANVIEINQFLEKKAEDLGDLKKTRAAAVDKKQCEKVLLITDAIVLVVVAIVVAVVTYGPPAGGALPAGVLRLGEARKRIDEALSDLAEWEADVLKQGRMTPELRAALKRGREISEQVKDVAVARDIFFHIARDRALAAQVLEAARARNRKAVEESLKRVVPGSDIDVEEVREDGELFLRLRTGKLAHCLSTSSKCGDKLITVTA